MSALRPQRRAQAFTLIEVLVAMTILVMLGTALILILRGGLHTWKKSEARRESYDQAEAVLLQLREDLLGTSPPFDTPLRGTPVESRFLVDVRHPENDPSAPPALRGIGQRLILVRSIKAESEHPITGHAGSAAGADRVIDFRDDLEEARTARLRATGGQMEVAWVRSEAGVLYRGVRTPIGPPGSLFEGASYSLAPLPSDAPAAGPTPAADARSPAPVAPAGALLRPFATDVIHFEVRLWSQYSRGTWSPAHRARWQLSSGETSGPLLSWDSTRSLDLKDPRDFEERDGRVRKGGFSPEPREFRTFVSASSLDDPRDDVIPTKVRVLLVLREPPVAGSSTFLTQEVGANDEEIFVQDPARIASEEDQRGFVYIGGEWIEYESVRGDRIVVAKDGRGKRSTTRRAHTMSEVVHVGKTFVTILEVPAHREDWGDAARRRRTSR